MQSDSTRHTPGPWKAEMAPNQFAESGWVAFVCGNYKDGCGDQLANVTTKFHEGGRQIPAEEWAANARLMAAAPDLLAALAQLTLPVNVHGESVTGSVTLVVSREDFDLARAALAQPPPASVRAERDPKTRALAREAALTTTAAEWLAEIEQQAHEQPERAYVALPGDWGRVLFILKDRDRFVGYEYGGAQVWTRKGGELDYFLAAPLGVQVLSRESAIALLAQAIEKGA